MMDPSACVSRVPIGGKRAFDSVASATLLIVLALPLLLIAAVVAADVRGSPIFSRQRIGWRGKPFAVLKFRTMRKVPAPIRPPSDAEVSFLYVPRDDPRVTLLGRFLRRCSVDEAPQLLNVLLGDMSLIGPRPFDAQDFEQESLPCPEHREWVRIRHCVRPGISGLWQVSGRNATSFAELIALDRMYVQEWTPALELSIVRKTLRAVVSGIGGS